MRFRGLFAFAVAAMLVAAPIIAHAADDASQVRRLELAKRVFASMNMDKMMADLTTSMVPGMTQQMRRAMPSLPEAQVQAINEAVMETMAAITPRLIDQMVPHYATTFSEKELTDMLAFYESDTGRAMMTKMPELMAKMAPLTAQMMPDVMSEMQTRICRKIDCKAARMPRPRPS